MEKINLNAYKVNAKKAYDSKEFTVCNYIGIERCKHDSQAYNKASDADNGKMAISVKSDGFSLMAGSLCAGLTDFNSIWNLFEANVHSDSFWYVTNDFQAYAMSIVEFKEFVYNFCGLAKESAKNGGTVKIRARHESKKMVAWLDAKIA